MYRVQELELIYFTVLLLTTSGQRQATYYNIEIVDRNGDPVGEFIKGDNICSSGRMLTHSLKEAMPSKKIAFTWRSPSYDMGTLFFR